MPVALAFAIIKLKTKQAQLAQIELTRRTLNQCKVNDEARCNVPAEVCDYSDCQRNILSKG